MEQRRLSWTVRRNHNRSPDRYRCGRLSRGWHLWMQSHHAFFFKFALLAHAYREANLIAATGGGGVRLRRWAERAGILWSGSGALMIFGCDFAPLQDLYCAHIRSGMPQAFSGFWLRERAAVHREMTQWNAIVPTAQFRDVPAADAVIKAGRQIYHRYHGHVIRAAVPDGKSLAQEYREDTSALTPSAMSSLECMIVGFVCLRTRDLSRLEFIHGAWSRRFLQQSSISGLHIVWILGRCSARCERHPLCHSHFW